MAPRATNRLTDAQCRKALPNPDGKPLRLTDGDGLFLLVDPKVKRWLMKCHVQGRETRLAFGTYPTVGLAEARQRREEVRRMLRDGIDPVIQRRASRACVAGTNSFEAVAREWHAKQQPKWSAQHAGANMRRMERHVFPAVGRLSVDALTAPALLAMVRRVEATGAHELTRRLVSLCSQVFRYAMATGRAQGDPSIALRGALAPVVVTHHASLTVPQAVGGLLRAIGVYTGSPVTRAALRLSPLLFVRPGELRTMEWAELDVDRAEWRIPGEKMKMRAPHIVPLSRQALAVLAELRPFTGTDGRGGNTRYVFPGERTRTRPMSNNTVNAALRRMGFAKDEQTAHGFRSLASTLLNEAGWNRDAIERQLAHAERDGVRAAYNYAEYLPERRAMMQWWADALDALAVGEPMPGRQG